MTPEQQRIALAGACGWIIVHPVSALGLDPADGLQERLPAYLSDLNALAAARDQLITTTERRIDWSNALRAVVGLTCERRNKAGQPQVSDLDMLFATPAQLAEALLKTLKLWIKP